MRTSRVLPFALTLLVTTPVLAQPVPAAPSATELRDQARQALAAGEVERACELLKQSDAAEPGEDVAFELAQCLERAGKPADARQVYERIGSQGGARAEEAKRRAEGLAPAPVPAAPVPAAPGPVAPKAPEAPTPPAAAAEAGTSTLGDDVKAWYRDYVDTRLSWTFGDDDLIHQTGQAQPLSPNISIGDRKQYRLFFDNLNSRFGGRENLTHLALYAKAPGFIDRLETEASLVLRFDIGALSQNTNNVNQALYDAGTFIRLAVRLGEKDKPIPNLSFTFWPIDTDRFRLGYLYDLSWGGTNAAINQSIFPRIQGSSPGAKVQFDSEAVSAFFGFKTATIVQPTETLTPGTSEVEVIRVGQTNYGLLGGLGVQAHEMFRFDLGGGYFQQGRFDLPDVSGQAVYTVGGSARITVHHPEMKAPQSTDFLLYRNDPQKPLQIFKPEKYESGKTLWQVLAEGTVLGQNLKDFDVTGATRLQPAVAGALQLNVKSGFFRVSATGIVRDLPFVLRNQPSFVPFETIPSEAKAGPEFFGALAADYHFDGPKLTPGLGFGVQLPATFKASSVDAGGNAIDRVVVVRQQGNLAILPVNEGALPIVQTRASLRWDASTILSALLWLQYMYDPNGTFVERDPSEGTVVQRTFISPSFFGLGTSVQARF
ncbi:MAG: tetratricopeptide repeat protein [Polyangiaceae bacterium]|nr:tetratricopeptide repeat protein [Polyangiaceae bacterium]